MKCASRLLAILDLSVNAIGAPKTYFNDLALFISLDLGAELLQLNNWAPTPDHLHNQQQIRQTFRVRLPRLAYPDATKIEAAAAAHGLEPDRRREGRIYC